MRVPRIPALALAALAATWVLGAPRAEATSPAATVAGATYAAPPDIPALPGSPASATGFVDVPPDSWEAGYVQELADAGVVSVPPDRRFRPDAPVTRLAFAVWVARALELPPDTAPLPFRDAAAIPASDRPLVGAAWHAGLVQGYANGLFAPDAPITRAALATIFGRALEAKGETPDPRYFDIWADAAEIPAWALPATVVMKDQLMYGEPCTPEACFAPDQPTTRAEAAALLVRFLQYLTETYHQAPLPPPQAPTGFRIEAWYSNSDVGYEQLQRYGGDFTDIVYGGYTIGPGGQLVGYDSPRTLTWASQHAGVALWVMVQASSLDFLSSPSEQASLVSAIAGVVKQAGYAGVNLDIEGVPPSEEAAFTTFVSSVAQAVHALGAQVSVDVPSETAADVGESWDGAYDYAALGAVVDQLVLMAYDYHSAGGPPGPISPIGWERQVLRYATSVVPPSKVVLGLPLYGYVWDTATDAATAYWELGMYNQASEHGAAISRDPVSDEATFSYVSGGVRYVGWFVDGQGAADRLEMAHAMGIGGVVLWRLDYEAPDWWAPLAQALAAWR
jgi:spore germination protein